ncbi:hypothetical protein [Geotalea sp. SG265]|uniref:hypothetical protein n=1 Tax=Geotalea sp. SG265 TaxID=2922867 RepID=UPI001FAF1F2A|nr:hypothetical protein [Geotalea sp. SG265]
MTRGFLATTMLFCSTLASVACADEMNFSGTGKAAITQDIAVTRTESMRAAKRDAVTVAITKLNGSTATNDPKVQAAIDQIVAQIGDEKIFDQTNSKDGANNFVTKVNIRMEELEFRKLMQDYGIASTVARNYPVMIVMDEFFTTKTDHSKPLRELVEYSHDKTATLDASHSASESASSANSESSSGNYSGAASMSASGSSSGAIAVDGNYASGRHSGSASASVREKSSHASASSSQSSASSSNEDKLFAQKKDVVNFKKLVEYQPQNVGPDKNNYTYAAIVREAAKFDLNLIDNDVFRSKYFTGKPLTMEEIQNSSELSRYVAAARDNKADYFMVGNTVIINNDKSPTSGNYVCDGLVTLKAYSTEDGTILATDARSESASGNSPDQCRANVANKLAGFVGATLGGTIHSYWRQREEYGREYNVRLISLLGNLSDDDKDAFAEALEKMDGVKSKVIERKSTRGEFEVALTYKGDRSISREIGSALKKVAAFKAVGRKTDGTTIKVCLEGPCPDKLP